MEGYVGRIVFRLYPHIGGPKGLVFVTPALRHNGTWYVQGSQGTTETQQMRKSDKIKKGRVPEILF